MIESVTVTETVITIVAVIVIVTGNVTVITPVEKEVEKEGGVEMVATRMKTTTVKHLVIAILQEQLLHLLPLLCSRKSQVLCTAIKHT